jgi:hypothetical protein
VCTVEGQFIAMMDAYCGNVKKSGLYVGSEAIWRLDICR